MLNAFKWALDKNRSLICLEVLTGACNGGSVDSVIDCRNEELQFESGMITLKTVT